MSCHSLPLWQYFFRKEWETYTAHIHRKLDFLDKLQAISAEKLSDAQIRTIQQLEIDINMMYSMKTMVFNLHKSYEANTKEVFKGYFTLWKESEMRKDEIKKLNLEKTAFMEQLKRNEILISILFKKRINPTKLIIAT
jgi:hypothetical protein